MQAVEAFVRRDFAEYEPMLRSDVVLHLPGSSWLAGTYVGAREVADCIVRLRQVLESSEQKVAFIHDDTHMIVAQEVGVHGPLHEVAMTFSIAITFDQDELIKTIAVEPDDLGLFDHVLTSALLASDTRPPG